MIKESYEFDYQKDRRFLVTRDNAWIPMNLLCYIAHLRRIYPQADPKDRQAFIKHTIFSGKLFYTKFDVQYGDFGHDPYNHIGRGMKP